MVRVISMSSSARCALSSSEMADGIPYDDYQPDPAPKARPLPMPQRAVIRKATAEKATPKKIVVGKVV